MLSEEVMFLRRGYSQSVAAICCPFCCAKAAFSLSAKWSLVWYPDNITVRDELSGSVPCPVSSTTSWQDRERSKTTRLSPGPGLVRSISKELSTPIRCGWPYCYVLGQCCHLASHSFTLSKDVHWRHSPPGFLWFNILVDFSFTRYGMRYLLGPPGWFSSPVILLNFTLYIIFL